jgi:hypothetical protein
MRVGFASTMSNGHTSAPIWGSSTGTDSSISQANPARPRPSSTPVCCSDSEETTYMMHKIYVRHRLLHVAAALHGSTELTRLSDRISGSLSFSIPTRPAHPLQASTSTHYNTVVDTGHFKVPLMFLMLNKVPLNIFWGTLKCASFTHASKCFWGIWLKCL